MGKTGYIYKCTDCGKEYSQVAGMYLCPECRSKNTTTKPPRGVLKTLYDYEMIRKNTRDFSELKQKGFIDLLPVNSCESFPKLRVGKTPLYSIDVCEGKKFVFHLHLKDDSQNPTYSFKDRASALVSAYARENNLKTIVTASTGNAGSSLAGICASQQQKAIIMVPETAPLAKLTQIIMYGASIVPVKGTYDEAFDLSLKATEEFGWYNRNTAFNPLTIEGKKTVAFELIEQLHFEVPDRIFVPVGDGVIISGVYKGFEDLLLLNFIDRMPTIVAVQSEKSDNMVRNIGQKDFTIVHSSTFADSISVDIPRNFFMAQQYLQKYNGERITVTDDDILNASSLLSKNTGLFAEPAAATAFAGLVSYKRNKIIQKGSSNVVLLTGSGLKDLKSVNSLIKIPASIYPTIDNLNKLLS
jgi:threonine synthase